MRLHWLTLLSGLLACLVPTAAQARQPTYIELYLRAGQGVSSGAPDEVETRLQLFVDSMPSNIRDSLGTLKVRRNRNWLSGGIPAMRDRWSDRETVAILSATLALEKGQLTAPGSVYIGPSDVHIMLGWPRNLASFIVRNDQTAEVLDMYQLIIGYALIVRAWQSNRAVVVPLADYVLRHSASMLRGSWGSSACRRTLKNTIAEVRLAAMGRQRQHHSTGSVPPLQCIPQT